MTAREQVRGKRVLITGAARGIGLAIAKRFLEEGAAVMLGDLSTSELEQSADELACVFGADRVARVVLDVCDESQAQNAVDKCVTNLGGLDTLVNNAGIVGRGYLHRCDMAAWRRVLEVNLYGTLHCSRAAINAIGASGGGAILNASSVSARLPDVGLSAYSVSKGAVEILTRILAAEIAPLGIRVNAYAPGVTHTCMTDDLVRTRGEEKLRHISLRRFGDPSDIASLVVFLASDDAAFITGGTFAIDGGTMIVEHPWKAWRTSD